MEEVYIIFADNLLEYEDNQVEPVLVCGSEEKAKGIIEEIYEWEKEAQIRTRTQNFTEVCDNCPYGRMVGFTALEYVPKEKDDEKVFGYEKANFIE